MVQAIELQIVAIKTEPKHSECGSRTTKNYRLVSSYNASGAAKVYNTQYMQETGRLQSLGKEP